MKRTIITALALLAAGAVGALLFAWSGLYNVAASREHWAVTNWVLHFTLRNSVETHAMAIQAPPLDDESMVFRGLGHYEGGCKPCHGAPGDAGNPIVQRILPQPPNLAESVSDWSDAELFWIVRNGLKYAGMPAWVAPERDDEVWSVVAFLRRMSGMPAEEYRRLARNDTIFDPEAVEQTAALLAQAGPVGGGLLACARCHGLRGEGGGAGAFPRLAGQKAEYLEAAMLAYAQGTRPSGIMQPIAAELSGEEIRRLSDHYAAMDPADGAPRPAAGDAVRLAPDHRETLALGRRIAEQGLPEQGVPACASCHGPSGRAEPGQRHALYPALEGQFAPYLVQQLTLWTQGKRGGNAYSRIMEAAVRTLRPEQIAAVAAHYAALPPAGAQAGTQAGERPQ
ncbi:c-type cytochrome [Azospirillum sp. RWY-5-1]|uniref:C-type cytochrome n=1 Tax=Azospirillum oleiclasticum TaxID=2735135 RepID=A0ABX2T5A9_9PROT|nr:c-type cytochrome [Azospirillum oleiclasticum]NYZ10932.1 c-type cytochrome [Azospirillum oleiclasticum]NYZ18094.1 c-type cytochrome [Azospirillum oleiclasticum]